MTRKFGKDSAWHTETLDSCFDLIWFHQQYIPCSPPLEIEPATTECKAKTLPLRYRSTLHPSDAKLTSHGNCVAINLMCLVSYIHTLTEDTVTSRATSSQRIGDMHSRHHNLMGKEIDIHLFYFFRENYIINWSYSDQVDCSRIYYD